MQLTTTPSSCLIAIPSKGRFDLVVSIGPPIFPRKLACTNCDCVGELCKWVRRLSTRWLLSIFGNLSIIIRTCFSERIEKAPHGLHGEERACYSIKILVCRRNLNNRRKGTQFISTRQKRRGDYKSSLLVQVKPLNSHMNTVARSAEGSNSRQQSLCMPDR